MPIKDFDYKGFAANMSEQAKELVPAGLKDFEKEYIVKTLSNFTMLAGEALYNDESLNLTAEQAILITQIIAEWSFHKSVDLIHSGILPEYWDTIMQKIAFTIFEIAKQAVIRKIPQEQMLQAVEHHVVKVYTECIEELQQKGIINEDVKNQAESQSNIDAMAKQAQEEQLKKQQMAEESARQAELKHQQREAEATQRKQNNKKAPVNSNMSLPQAGMITQKQVKLMSLALVLKILSQDKVTTILNKFNPTDSQAISQYMDIANLESQIDGDLIADCIQEIKEFLPVKRKLSKENILSAFKTIYSKYPREQVEKVIRNERPLVKRFLSKTYDGEFGELPLKVAGIVTEYIEESI